MTVANELLSDLFPQYLCGEVDMTLQNYWARPWLCAYYSCVHIVVIIHICRKLDTKWSGDDVACFDFWKHCQLKKKKAPSPAKKTEKLKNP